MSNWIHLKLLVCTILMSVMMLNCKKKEPNSSEKSTQNSFISVAAAANLRDVLEDLKQIYIKENPDKKVVLFTGDGSIMMNCQEFATVADYNLDIKVVVLNNHMLGMVAQWQRMFYNHHYSHSVLRGKTDLVKLAQAMGVNGYRIDNKTTFNEQLANYINSDGACLIDILIPDEENVFPMVPAGGRLDQMVLEAEQ